MTAATCLVVAKAPVPGQAKSRLAAAVGEEAAARLAAAALVDTLEVCAEAFPQCVAALTGDLRAAPDGAWVAAALKGWNVVEQRGATFAERLEHAHRDAHTLCPGAVVQVGMDTPHLSGALLREVAQTLTEDAVDAVLGEAFDGGWWILGVRHPGWVDGLGGVEMSSPRSGRLTRALLEGNGARLVSTAPMGDIDTAEDACALSTHLAGTHFARAWTETVR